MPMNKSALRFLILLLFFFRIFFFCYDVTAGAVIAPFCPLVVTEQTREIGVTSDSFYVFSRKSDGQTDVFR